MENITFLRFLGLSWSLKADKLCPFEEDICKNETKSKSDFFGNIKKYHEHWDISGNKLMIETVPIPKMIQVSKNEMD